MWNPWAFIALRYSQNNVVLVDRTFTTSTSLGHMWTTENSNLTSQTKYTTFSDRTVIDLWGSIFTRSISEETGRNLIQAILDRYPSICQNNPSSSQNNTANNTQPFPSNEMPLNNPFFLNLDPEPLLPTQNQNKTLSPSSNNPKHNNKPLNDISTPKCLNQQTPPLQIHKHLPWLPLTQQEFLNTEPLDHHQRTLATCSITSSENLQ